MKRLTKYGRDNTMVEYKNKIIDFEKKYNEHNQMMKIELSEEKLKDLNILQRLNRKLEL